MKLTLGFTVALFACAATAHVQGTSVGVKAGFNLADLSIKDAGSIVASNRTGLVAGVFVTIPGSGIFAFQPEVLIGMQGAKFTLAPRSWPSRPGCAILARARWASGPRPARGVRERTFRNGRRP